MIYGKITGRRIGRVYGQEYLMFICDLLRIEEVTEDDTRQV